MMSYHTLVGMFCRFNTHPLRHDYRLVIKPHQPEYSANMAGCFLYLADTFTDWFLYRTHLHICKQLCDSRDLPEPTEDPLQVLELCQGNIGRWIVFMVWLETCPNAFYCFQEIRRRYQIPSIVTLDHLLQQKASLKDTKFSHQT